MKYMWPIMIGAVGQLLWNGVLTVYLGNFDSIVGDWLYGRNCDRLWSCDGILANLIFWGLILVVFASNAIYQIHNRSQNAITR